MEREPLRVAIDHVRVVRVLSIILLFPVLLHFFAGLVMAADVVRDHHPRVGLVLSGGGARGTAHIGVLKVLEELRIPIDVIVGTSMGAIVGGMYAAGSSPDEIEQLVTSIQWNEAFMDRPALEDLSFRRKQDSAGQMIKFDAGIRNGRLSLPLGLVQGQNLNFILKSQLLHAALIDDFDRLMVPFRAVAADIETGKAVIMGKGDLAAAIRASMSIPGVFAPVEMDGRLLVDGGIANNLPVDVARNMGVDVLIAVNVGTLRRSRENLTSAMMITTQVMTILIQKNTDEQAATLREGDFLLQPELGSVGSGDFGKASEAIRAGEEVARRAADRLRKLALPEKSYALRLAAQRRLPFTMPVVSSVSISNNSPIADEVVQAQCRTRAGDTLDLKTLEEDLKRIYSVYTFEKVDFRLTDRDGNKGLVIDAKEKSWGPSYLRLGLGIEDDFRGSAGYNVSVDLTATSLNRLGAEWKSHLQMGDTPRFFTEFYQPLDSGLNYFIVPRGEYRSWNINSYSEKLTISQYRATLFEAGVDIGRQFGNWGQLCLGLRRGYGDVGVRIGSPQPNVAFDTGYLWGAFAYDRLDSFNFPRKGTSADLSLMISRTELGSDSDGKGLAANVITAFSKWRHTILAGLSVQTSLDSDALLQNRYSLGGFLNLSGFAQDELSGQHTGLARLIYYYELGSTGLGEFRMPLYIGGSMEAGNAWESKGDISARTLVYAGSLLIGAETYLGPVYLAYGVAEEGQRSIYLYVGHKF
jgi:NTE family protein